MSVIAFDTLKFCKRLEQAGIPADHPAATASAFADAMTDALATKQDIAELRAEINSVRAEFKRDVVELRTELKHDMTELELRMTVKRGALMVVSVGAAATLVKLL